MKLVAEFDLDDEGRPIQVRGGGIQHYAILLKVLEAPASVRRVRYRLYPDYREPTRDVSARIPDFEEPITSYGDYEITVEYTDEGNRKQLKRKLSEALAEGHKKPNESIAAALRAIRSN